MKWNYCLFLQIPFANSQSCSVTRNPPGIIFTCCKFEQQAGLATLDDCVKACIKNNDSQQEEAKACTGVNYDSKTGACDFLEAPDVFSSIYGMKYLKRGDDSSLSALISCKGGN